MVGKHSSNRSMVVLLGSVVDAVLADLVSSWLLPDKAVEDFFCPPGFLSTFGSRKNLAFALGLVTEDEKRDLQVIADVRNFFAHHLLDATFSDAEVTASLRRLRSIVNLSPGDTPRDRFRKAVFQLVPRLRERMVNFTTRDGYRAWLEKRDETELEAAHPGVGANSAGPMPRRRARRSGA